MTITPFTAAFQKGDLCYGFSYLKNPELAELKQRFVILSVGQRRTLAENLKNLGDPAISDQTKEEARLYLEGIPEALRQFYQNLSVEFTNFEARFSSWSPFYNRNVQKICKLYLLWAYFYGYKIHFIVDNINMRYVTEKDDPYERGVRNMVRFDPYYLQRNYLMKNIITHSELRFIYRNWSFLKKTVLFWEINPQSEQLEPISPPWEWPNEKMTPAYDLLRENELQSPKKEPPTFLSVSLLWRQYGEKYKSRETQKILQAKIETFLKRFSRLTLSTPEIRRRTLCLYHELKTKPLIDQKLEQYLEPLLEI